ncbi:Phosphopantothenoylcysteine decarboxylase [Seminavis robusta]|uniref:Phosphopantothenoylcysteine decarboxylase n=1 Tax=Seminavis robusta TaxID=568900 RepID=A0A9N8HHR3_9STRA|nr:Phosphopantothenoylcysteine decarboxylase [Seminavis robusta]|eukprot:Sro461_g147690.1 Phosphopantothenoylcysteine decarboxylase (394) ;mRNA; r:12544-13826
MQRQRRVLLAVTGSVAAVKSCELAVRLVEEGNQVRVLLTQGGRHFWDKSKEYNPTVWQKLQQLIQVDSALKSSSSDNEESQNRIQIHDSDEEWRDWNRMGDPVLHIELRDWADICVIAPLSAHTLAKIAQGLCDDTTTCVLRAWDFGHGTRPGKPIILAPAMNTAMYNHPLTQRHLSTVQGFWKEHSNDNPENGESPLSNPKTKQQSASTSSQIMELALARARNQTTMEENRRRENVETQQLMEKLFATLDQEQSTATGGSEAIQTQLPENTCITASSADLAKLATQLVERQRILEDDRKLREENRRRENSMIEDLIARVATVPPQSTSHSVSAPALDPPPAQSNPNIINATCSGVFIVEPQVKTLACGEVGKGAMASVDNILSAVRSALDSC